MKKLVSILLALCTAILLFPAAAFAENEEGTEQLVVVGDFGNYNSSANWSPYCEDFMMTYDSDSEIYSLTLENMEAGAYVFRIIQFGDWSGTQYNLEGSGENNLANSQLVVEYDGSTVVFTCDLTKAYCTVTPPAGPDTEAPVISYIYDGNTYCGSVYFAVTDNFEVSSVTVNGATLTATDGLYSLEGFTGTLAIVATDTSSNATTITITVNEHNYKLGQCTECNAEDPDASAIVIAIGNIYRAIASAFAGFITWISGIFA